MTRVRGLWAIVLSLTFCTFSAVAGPLDTLLPGQWYEVPNSRMDALDPCPLDNCVYSGASGQSDVINAWNGGAYDTTRDRLVLWGGGHAGYAGNEIYVFDVNSLSWMRLTNPSTQPANLADPYPDGTPNPRHTYGTSVYIPTVDRFWAAGGSIWKDGPCTGGIWTYKFGASPPESGWRREVSSFNGDGFGDCGGLAVYDAGRDRVLALVKHSGLAQLLAFNPSNPSAPWTLLNGNADRRAYQMGAVDPKRRKLVVVGAGGTWTYDVDVSGAPLTKLSTSGATGIESSDAPGVAYDPVSDRIVAWAGGQNVYTLNMDTRVWEIRSPTNSVNPGSVTASGGTWGRFQYVPSKNVFVVVNSVSKNVFFYKLSSATGLAPPQQPQKPNVNVNK
jgi:hypothetical protein